MTGPDASVVAGSPRGAERLELILSINGFWRLCDTMAAPDDPAYVLAYVELVDDGFDVVWLLGSRGRGRYATIEQIMAHGGRVLDDDVSSPTRPIDIPHVRPTGPDGRLPTSGLAPA